MATSGSLNTTKYEGRYLQLTWEATQSTANNQSTIKWTLKGAGDAQSSWYYAAPFRVEIAGDVVYSSSTRIQLYKGTTVASGTKTIKHNTDGSKSVTMSVKGAIYVTSYNCTGSKTFTLTKIPRAATIKSAPNFNDTQNPTITYSNPAGTAVTTLEACISFTGANDDIPYRAISKTGTSYTFNLTEAERNILRAGVTSGNSRTVRFYVRTVINGTSYQSYLSKTFSLANGQPTLSPSVYDNNATTVALTGDRNKFIKYYSNAYFTVGAQGQSGATIVSQGVKCGNKSANTATGTLTAVESGDFEFYTTDSRNLTTNVILAKDLVEYIKLTTNVNIENPNAAGQLQLSINGNFFNGSFGARTNTLTVQYRYKAESGSFTSWYTVTASKSGNTYTATTTVTGLDYRQSYIFESRAVDLLDEITAQSNPVKTQPIFDWSGEDFNLNVPLNMNSKTVLRESNDYNHTILSSNGGSIYFRPNSTDDATSEARLFEDGTFKVNGSIIANNMPSVTLYSGDSYITSKGLLATNGEHGLGLYVCKPFNFVFFRMFVDGFQKAVSAGTSYQTLCTIDTDFAPAYITALSGSAIKDFSVILNGSAEVRVSPKDGFTTGNQCYISGFYPLSSSSPYYV